ncbi:MAG: hypothetical protein IPM36_23945 [Lewinellaceae bacterium]|nr:hypothetical protein [Lewinellaceae bacterium]
MNISRHFFAQLGAAKPQYFDAGSPYLYRLSGKPRAGWGVLLLAGYLPVPEEKAQEIAIEFFIQEKKTKRLGYCRRNFESRTQYIYGNVIFTTKRFSHRHFEYSPAADYYLNMSHSEF